MMLGEKKMTGNMKIGNRTFTFGKKVYIMGILNVTPDSFSDGGKYGDLDAALKHTEEMIKEGADIIDVGGESTRPGHVKISVAEEIERTCFVIEAIKERFEIPVSLDTYKYQVAQAGILAGADLINDIWGFKWDDERSLSNKYSMSSSSCNPSSVVYKSGVSLSQANSLSFNRDLAIARISRLVFSPSNIFLSFSVFFL